ncbi:MAG: hypothetical protein AB8I08_26735 [Sandaracinaceae bacterium]
MRASLYAGLFCGLLVVGPSLLAGVSDAHAQDADAAPGADAYTQAVQQGIARLVAGDIGGGQEALRGAVEMDGSRAPAVYYLASASRMSSNFDEALAGFQRAAELAEASNEARWQARALQGVASTLERMEGRLDEVYAAWQAYVRFADAHQAVAFPQLGRARIQAYNMVTEQEAAYVAVRQRIAERERANAE